MKRITQEGFWSLTKVVECQNIQKVNRYGSVKHRNAYKTIFNLAVNHGVEQYFEAMEQYDAF